MSNKTYDRIKWVLFTLVPASIALIEGLGLLYDFNTTLIIGTISLVATFVGTITGLSSVKYHKKVKNK